MGRTSKEKFNAYEFKRGFFYLISYTTKRCISVWYLFLNDPSGKLISRDAILNHSCKDSFEIYFNKKYEKGKTFYIPLALPSYINLLVMFAFIPL